jgi:tRNA(Ile)-lysidine synthase
LSELAQTSYKFNSLICGFADKVWQQSADCTADSILLDLELFLSQSLPVKIELICRSLTHIGCGQGNLTEEHFEGILKLAKQNIGGKKIVLPGKYRVWREYEDLIFSITPAAAPHIKPTTLEIPGKTRFDNYSIEAEVLDAAKTNLEEFKATKTPFIEWFDLDKLLLPLVVRRRNSGDKFVPLGQTLGKKVGKFLTAAKVRQELRRNLFIVADRKKIIWVCPIRISEQTKITDDARRILQLRIRKK